MIFDGRNIYDPDEIKRHGFSIFRNRKKMRAEWEHEEIGQKGERAREKGRKGRMGEWERNLLQ